MTDTDTDTDTEEDKIKDKADTIKDKAYKKRMCIGREKTTLQKLNVIKTSLADGTKMPQSLKIIDTIINDMNKKREDLKLKRKKYDGF
jgi:hypothetical protein